MVNSVLSESIDPFFFYYAPAQAAEGTDEFLNLCNSPTLPPSIAESGQETQMGNCTPGSGKAYGRNDAFVPTGANDVADRRTTPAALTTRKNRAVQSLIRVGSLVLRADPFESHDGNRNNPENGRVIESPKRTTMENHKASTYDHVHQIVSCANV